MSHGRIAEVGGGLFDIEGLYGKKSFWTFTLGVRVAVGGSHRMGRYGAAASSGHTHQHRDDR
jgi:hypothetical protein